MLKTATHQSRLKFEQKPAFVYQGLKQCEDANRLARKKGFAICLAGWGQDSQEFSNKITKILCDSGLKSFETKAFDYQSCESFSEAAREVSNLKNPEIVFGWSLGGQVVLRLISEEIIAPKFLVLISTPICLVEKSDSSKKEEENYIKQNKRDKFKSVPRSEFKAFIRSFKADPENFLSNFTKKIHSNSKKKGETDFVELKKFLTTQDPDFSRLFYWLKWLGGFDGNSLEIKNFPQTLIIHCQDDEIVPYQQSFELQKLLNKTKSLEPKTSPKFAFKSESQVEILPGTSHAPHLFYPKEISEFLFARLVKSGIVNRF